MAIAGETSGDALAAELLQALPQALATRLPGLNPRCFGAGGDAMAGAGVELLIDLTRHSVIGIWEVVRRYHEFRGIFNRLLDAALERQPDLLLCVDYSGFNRRFAAALKQAARERDPGGQGWHPLVVQLVSPQVWASRPGRAQQLERDVDLLLSIFPFEKAWYARHTPRLAVEFVGHPMIDRHALALRQLKSTPAADRREILLLPGSRQAELRRHLPALLGAARLLLKDTGPVFRMVLPNEELLAVARETIDLVGVSVTTQIGGLAEALIKARLALASTGTVTMECALFGVPTVAMYKTSWPTYLIGKQVVNVRYLAMPNLLADEVVYPEFIQADATAENLAQSARELWCNAKRHRETQEKLARIIASLGGPGAAQRAAEAVAGLIQGRITAPTGK
jgi:lipid-A-disaccharide synthase